MCGKYVTLYAYGSSWTNWWYIYIYDKWTVDICHWILRASMAVKEHLWHESSWARVCYWEAFKYAWEWGYHEMVQWGRARRDDQPDHSGPNSFPPLSYPPSRMHLRTQRRARANLYTSTHTHTHIYIFIIYYICIYWCFVSFWTPVYEVQTTFFNDRLYSFTSSAKGAEVARVNRSLMLSHFNFIVVSSRRTAQRAAGSCNLQKTVPSARLLSTRMVAATTCIVNSVTTTSVGFALVSHSHLLSHTIFFYTHARPQSLCRLPVHSPPHARTRTRFKSIAFTASLLYLTTPFPPLRLRRPLWAHDVCAHV